MKTGKVVLLLGIVCSVFFAAIGSVSAIDETKTLTDAEDDVVFTDPNTFDEILTDQRPNVDITQVTYTKSGTAVTVTLQVNNKGVIEDKGDLYSNNDFVSYVIQIITTTDDSSNEYDITYTNQTCQLGIGLSGTLENITDYTVDGSTLTVNFGLSSEDEICEAIQAASLDIDFSNFKIYADEVNDQPLQADAGYPLEGNVGEAVEFVGTAQGGSYPYTYAWDFDDGATETGNFIEHTYSSAGEYTVILTVTDYDGQTETATVTVTILGEDNGDDNGGTNSNLLIFGTLIIIIAIAGIIAVVIIIRR